MVVDEQIEVKVQPSITHFHCPNEFFNLFESLLRNLILNLYFAIPKVVQNRGKYQNSWADQRSSVKPWNSAEKLKTFILSSILNVNIFSFLDFATNIRWERKDPEEIMNILLKDWDKLGYVHGLITIKTSWVDFHCIKLINTT